jgi:hypothetical protein
MFGDCWCMRTQETAQGEAGRRGLRASGRAITWSYSGSCKWTSEISPSMQLGELIFFGYAEFPKVASCAQGRSAGKRGANRWRVRG